MKARKNADILKAVHEAHIQLRSCGLPVHKLHADRAREYTTKALEQWAASRDIDLSTTQGDDPSQNGTAERAVRFLKMRKRILLQQAKELSGLSTELVASLWPYAAETASAQQQAEVWGQPSPLALVRRFSREGRVMAKEAERTFCRNGSKEYILFQDPPLRRVRRKSSVIDLAGGVGLLPGFDKEVVAAGDEKAGLRALAMLAKAEVEPSSEDVVSDGLSMGHEEGLESSASKVSARRDDRPLAEQVYVKSERFRKTKKQRAAAWQANDPPSVHTTLGAYQRGPWTGMTTATARHESLASYLTAMLRHHEGKPMVFSVLTIAKDFNTDAHKDKFNMRGSRNYVLTLGNFENGEIWQEGTSDSHPAGSMELGSGEDRMGYVEPVHNKVVQASSVCPRSFAEDFEGVAEAVNEANKSLEVRESVSLPDRPGGEQWMSLCRMTEGTDEIDGVEPLLETLSGPLKVVYTVALDEVKQFFPRWAASIVKEADALIKAKALVPSTLEEQRALERSGKLVILPAKGVFTMKPLDGEVLPQDADQPLPPGDPCFYKRKARLVICGNFQGKQSMEESYAGGCQTDCLRVMLVHCAAVAWCLASTDIRNAFILAPIQEEDDEEEDVYALYPPKVFQLAKVQYAMQLWRVIPYDGGYIYLKQHRADENMRSVCVFAADGSTTVRAYVNVYIDDILYVGEPDIIQELHQWLTSEWKASELTWASEETTIRFLGLEISRNSHGSVKIHQRGFIEELLRHHGLSEARGHLTPCPQEWLLGEAECSQEDYTPGGTSSHRYLQQPVAWCSGRQALVSWSVAEAELIETINTTQMAYGISAITEELHHVPAEIVVKVDNSAAVGLSNEAGGSWKTRHLKVRAYHLREAVHLRELRIEHIAGKLQLGDLGTKAFNRPRLVELLNLWGLLVLLMGWMVQGSRASTTSEPEERGIEVSMPWELYGLILLGLVAAIGVWEAIKWFFEWISLRRSGSVEESRGARRLRRLQQAVQEEVARYGLMIQFKNVVHRTVCDE
ncbi:unnamed protein product [Symbiodinium sp. CCMP2592]|nr:unnamed protein product [Symbiodinium sp. CCMP2592]